MKYNAIFYIEKLLNFYNVNTISELAILLKTRQTSISSWKSRNSINAIKKKCRALDIYDEIFGDNQKTNTNENIEQKKEFSSPLIFNNDVIAVLHTAATVVNESNKGSFIQLIKEWIVKNI